MNILNKVNIHDELPEGTRERRYGKTSDKTSDYDIKAMYKWL